MIYENTIPGMRSPKGNRDQDGLQKPQEQLKLNFYIMLKNNTSFVTAVSVRFICILLVIDFCFLKCYFMAHI